MPPYASNCFRICSAREKSSFESGRATIDPDSAGLLDRLIETALRCPTANIEIAGHTDADGEDGLQPGAVGKARAGGRRIIWSRPDCPPTASRRSGYGSTQPVAGNDTDEGKAQNRRIDFVVR